MVPNIDSGWSVPASREFLRPRTVIRYQYSPPSLPIPHRAATYESRRSAEGSDDHGCERLWLCPAAASIPTCDRHSHRTGHRAPKRDRVTLTASGGREAGGGGQAQGADLTTSLIELYHRYLNYNQPTSIVAISIPSPHARQVPMVPRRFQLFCKINLSCGPDHTQGS